MKNYSSWQPEYDKPFKRFVSLTDYTSNDDINKYDKQMAWSGA